MPEDKIDGENMHIRCKVIIEILGKPKGHVEETLRMYVNKIRMDSEIIVLNTEFADAVEKENMWAIFAELEMIIKGMPKLIAFCFNYMPSSIEILKPEEFALKKSTIENFINDLQARLHELDMIVKRERNKNDFLTLNLSKSLSNVILVSLAFGSLDMDKLSKVTGIPEKELEIFLDSLIKEDKIIKDDSLYSLVK
ncbi:hypothetical protein HYX01_03980 [Candidatus Woesearchaeota archaeon]|nr:hypothetical protein [Candidatus Woesearchaeota archaeon]